MNKIWLIIRREYTTRVQKKSFIIMTILGPLLMAALMIVPIWISQISDEVKTIAVLDEYHSIYQYGPFYKKLKETPNLKFEYINTDILTAKEDLANSKYYALLYIPQTFIGNASKVALYSNDQTALNIKIYLENELEKTLEKIKMNAYMEEELKKLPIDTSQLKTPLYELSNIITSNLKASTKSPVHIKTVKLDKDGFEEKSSSEVITILAFISGFLIYMFVFIFGAQVMRGVIEEKTNRIVEIMISSVKPFQLMMGKIIGIAMVGLTQFLLWVILTFSIVTLIQSAFPGKFNFNRTEQILAQEQLATQTSANLEQAFQTNEMLIAIGSIDFFTIISMFIFYFLGGYLFYAALFAAIGSAVDNETDTQQFMLPISLPLVLSLIMTQFIINNPQGPIAYWLSIIPFTSPVIMMVRIPFGVPVFTDGFDLIISMISLIAGIFINIFIASKVYRTGILMYGKKPSYKEIWKWLKYRN